MKQLLKGLTLIEYFQSLAPNKRPQKNNSFITLTESINSSVVPVKIHLFRYLANILNAYNISDFQADNLVDN